MEKRAACFNKLASVSTFLSSSRHSCLKDSTSFTACLTPSLILIWDARISSTFGRGLCVIVTSISETSSFPAPVKEITKNFLKVWAIHQDSYLQQRLSSHSKNWQEQCHVTTRNNVINVPRDQIHDVQRRKWNGQRKMETLILTRP